MPEHLVVIAGDVDDLRTALGTLEQAPDHVVVRGGPVEFLLEPPAVDHVEQATTWGLAPYRVSCAPERGVEVVKHGSEKERIREGCGGRGRSAGRRCACEAGIKNIESRSEVTTVEVPKKRT